MLMGQPKCILGNAGVRKINPWFFIVNPARANDFSRTASYREYKGVRAREPIEGLAFARLPQVEASLIKTAL